eukprot:scaffold34921_cov162-Amphora_coffeaeformis.AAC.13
MLSDRSRPAPDNSSMRSLSPCFYVTITNQLTKRIVLGEVVGMEAIGDAFAVLHLLQRLLPPTLLLCSDKRVQEVLSYGSCG